jgi:hypothetical protein
MSLDDFRPWTSKEIARLRQLRAAGLTRRAIAADLGRTLRAVGNAITRFGLPRGPGAHRRPFTFVA